MNGEMLVADMGGTNARFALASYTDGKVSIREKRGYRAAEFPTLIDAAKAFLDAVGTKPRRACFAVAGPVIDDVVDFTNSPWTLPVSETKAALSLETLHVVNDFYALAAGALHLPEKGFEVVRAGAGDPSAPRVVLGPGTGFGQALVVPVDGAHRVVATEGGHVGVSPGTEEELAVFAELARAAPRVFVERAVSGPGIVNLYRALSALAGDAPAFDSPDDVTQAALAGSDARAVRTVELFCELLGRAAGDAVLGCGARGGVILGGGILPKIRDFFRRTRFVACFLDKARQREYVEDVPVRLIVDDAAALYGAGYVLAAAGAPALR
ncbi:glucokinase [Amphiplicatus metriothermophilus]|uniref:Glucokinase n=1 Tax=Amphiplicatus metriothermophilus TaxID=1519374 RepID=A0A239PPF6_9PROT|nr:glucokinase [Amphiplicatus metriothermophilus]MBB5518815.1 glucokinase [Amphiplicatus metriothermophilus]SNT72030.1 glucokinase [Amphiplicatus metriothermophilus]